MSVPRKRWSMLWLAHAQDQPKQFTGRNFSSSGNSLIFVLPLNKFKILLFRCTRPFLCTSIMNLEQIYPHKSLPFFFLPLLRGVFCSRYCGYPFYRWRDWASRKHKVQGWPQKPDSASQAGVFCSEEYNRQKGRQVTERRGGGRGGSWIIV